MKVKFIAFLTLGLLFAQAALAADPYIFVSTEDGFSQLSGTTLSRFDAITSVWLNAGPIFCTTPNGIADGTYYFQVIDSTGKLLSSDAVSARSFKVSGGIVTGFTGTGHLTSFGPCSSVSIQLMPFATTTGTYTVQVAKDTAFKTAPLSTTFTVATPTAQAGWLVSYYTSVQQNVQITPKSRYNSPALQSYTTSLDYSSNWAIGALGIKLDGAYFAATFTAVLTAPSTGDYTFTATGREGVRLWIDGTKVIDNWVKTNNIISKSGKITLQAGSKYQFLVEYFNGIGTPSFVLKWAIGTAAAVVVPSSAFAAAELPFGCQSEKTIYGCADNTHPESELSTSSTQTTPRSLPSGYSVSTLTTANAAILSYKWGCDCLVNANGLTIPVTTAGANGKCGSAVVKKSTVNNVDFFAITPPTGSKLVYKLLISSPCAANPNEYIVPTDTITYSGREWALLDGEGANQPGNGDCKGAQTFWKVPPGWVIGSGGKTLEASLVAVSFGFSGARGLVLEDGSIISTDSGTLIGLDGLEANGLFTRAKAKTFCTRVVISRDTTKANSWAAATITNYISCPDLDCEYATIDNANPLGSGTSFGCPPLALPLPTGWTLAKRNSKFESFIADRSITFGAYCLTYDDGTGFLTIADSSVTDRTTTCGTAQLKGVSTLAKVSTTKRQAIKGAIWTSTVDGTAVDANIYPAKTDVYLTGGPTNCQGQGLPDGDYYFQVTDPPGKVLLSTDGIEDRRVSVKNGRVSGTLGPHKTTVGVCGTMVQLVPYLDSPNNGGEYKAWMTPVENYDNSKGAYSFGFGHASTKTDNFKVRTYNTTDVAKTGVYGVRDCSVPRRILIQRCPSDVVTTAPPVSNTPCGSCTAWGDPHVTTFWGAQYNFFGIGSFTYAEPTATTKTWRVWGYLSKVQSASANTQLIFEYNGDKVNFSVPPVSKQVSAITMQRNGVVVTDPNSETGKQVTVIKNKASQYTVTLPNGIIATVTLDYWNINMLTLQFSVPTTLKGLTQGLCGTCGDKVFRFGSTTKTSISGSEDAYGKQWVVPNTPLESHTANYAAVCDDATVTAKAIDVCSTQKNDVDKNNCIIDYCNTLHNGVNTGATKYAGADNSLCVKTTDKTTTTFCPVSTPGLNNITRFGGRDYATLDFIHPNDRSAGSQLGFLSPPDGWKIAEDYPVRHALATCARFGTTCLTFAEGTAISQSLQKCGSTTSTNIQSAQDDCWKPLTTGRIIVTTDIPTNPTDPVSTGTVAFTTTADSASKLGSGLEFNSPNGALVQATISVPYGSDAAFSVFSWSKTKVAGKAGSNAFYGIQVDLKYTDGTTASNVASAAFDTADTNWNRRWADVIPSKSVQNITIRLVLTGYTGSNVLFSDWTVDEASKWGSANLLKDPTVQITDVTASPWKTFKGGWSYSTEDNTFGDASGSIKLTTGASEKFATAQDYGAIQVIQMSNFPQFSNVMTGLYFRGDAKILSGTIAGTYGAGFSLYVDVFYTDNTNASYGINAQFSRNTTGWQTAEKYALIRNKPVSHIQLVALFRLSTGSAVFDNIYLTPLYCNFPYPPSDSPSTSYGDPHLVTLDGHPYDCQLVGDFILLQDQSLTIITRHSRAGLAAVNSMTSFIYNDTSFTFERNTDTNPPLFTVNGKKVYLNPGSTIILPNEIGTITAVGSLAPPQKAIRYDIDLPTTGHKIVLTANVGDFKVQWLQVYPLLPTTSINMTRGLLGVYNFDPSDDFTSSLGRVISIDSDELTVYRDFAWSWKLDGSALNNELDANALQVEPIPEKVLSTKDFYPAEVAVAEKACAGIALYSSCVLDVLLSGDAGYASGYNSLESILSSSDVSKPAQQSLDSDDSSSRYRETVIIVVFSVLGGLLIVGLIVGVIVWKKSQRPRRVGTESVNRNLVG